MKEKTLWGIIVLLLVTSVVSCGGCSFGLNKEAQGQLKELNNNLRGVKEHLQVLEVLGTKIDTLNEHLAEHKDTEQTIKEATEVMAGIRDELKSLNDTLKGAVKIKKLLSP